MRILAIETSTMLGGVAIVDEEGLISEIRLNVSVEHSERLIPEIAHLLEESRLSISDIEAFAISAGPGSFTGLRVGMATVKGLCYATGRPMVAVPTLDAMAWSFPYSRYPVCPVIDARRSQVFTAIYRWERDGFITLKESSVVDRSRFVEFVRSILPDEEVIITGNGHLFYKGIEGFLIPPPEKLYPSAVNVGLVGLRLAKEGRFVDPEGFTPLYLRRSQAEENIRIHERIEDKTNGAL